MTIIRSMLVAISMSILAFTPSGAKDLASSMMRSGSTSFGASVSLAAACESDKTREGIEKQIADLNSGEVFKSVELRGKRADWFSKAYTKVTGSVVPEGIDTHIIYNMGDGTALVTGYTEGCFVGAARIAVPLLMEINKTAEDLQVNN